MEGQVQLGRHHLWRGHRGPLFGLRKFYADEDSTVAAKFLFRSSRDNMFSFLKASSQAAAAQAEFKRGREVLLDAQQLHGYPILKTVLWFVEP